MSEDIPIDPPMTTVRKSGFSKLFKQTVPPFILEEYPLMVEFLEAYYEWLDQTGNPIEFLQNGQKYFDVDTTSDAFLEHFKSNFLNAFPKNLTIHNGKTLDQRSLIKNIRDFYKLKGSEKSINLLFKIITDSDTRIEYPREKIFTLSGAEYKDYRTIYLLKDYSNFSRGFDLSQIGGLVVTQAQGFFSPIASATIEQGYEITRSGKSWIVLNVSNVVGEFVVSDVVPLSIEQDGVEYQWYSGTCVSRLSIENSGSGYFVGDRIYVGNTLSDHLRGIVTLTTDSGGISSVDLFDHPVEYRGGTGISIITDEGIGATLSLVTGGMTEILETYKNDKNIIGRESKIQDSFYYQQYSYVVKSKRSLEEYVDAIKTVLHPSGFVLFNDLYNNIPVVKPTEYKTRITRNEVPYLGSYAFYSPTTIQDGGNTYFAGWNPGNCFGYGGQFAYWEIGGEPLEDGELVDPTLSPTSYGNDGFQQFMNPGGLTLRYGSGETGLQADGLTLWRGFPHPNTRGMTAISAGISFGDVKLGKMLELLIRRANTGGTGWESTVQQRMLLGRQDTTIQNSTVKTPVSPTLIYEYNRGRNTETVRRIQSAAAYTRYSISIPEISGGESLGAIDDIPIIA